VFSLARFRCLAAVLVLALAGLLFGAAPVFVKETHFLLSTFNGSGAPHPLGSAGSGLPHGVAFDGSVSGGDVYAATSVAEPGGRFAEVIDRALRLWKSCDLRSPTSMIADGSLR
jgi:hypothetical protein